MADGERIGLEAVLEDENFQSGLNSYMSGLDNMGEATGVVGDLVSGIFMGLGMKIVEWGASAVLAIGDAFVQIGETVWDNGQLMDEAFDGIAIATGATGAELALLQEDFRTVFASVPVDAATVSEAISILNQRFETTGEVLTDLATPLIEASRMMGEDASQNATALADAMGLWNVSTEEGAGLLDELFVAAQEGGMGMSALLSTLTASTPALQAMGFSLDESIALITTLEDAGINSSTAVLGMRTALRDFTAEGIPAREGLANLITEIEGAATPTDAMNLAIEAFGTRAGPAMVTAIQNGTFNLETMLAVLEGADGKIMDTAASTADFGEQWKIFQNKSQLALEPLGIALLGIATSVMDKMAPAFDTLIGIFTDDFLPLITTYVLPFIDELIAAFGRLAVGNFEGAMRGLFSPEIANTIIAIKDVFVGFWGELTGAFDRLAAGNFAGAMRGLFPPEIANTIIVVKDVLVTLWNEALVPLWGWLTENIPIMMTAFSGFWTGTLMPIFMELWGWLSANLPLAIQTLSDFWTNTLVPAFGALSDFWSDTLQPALAAMWGYFMDNILPALAELADWYATNIPVIVGQIGEWWNDTLKPALDEMWAAFSENILPILAEVATWFGENLPVAVGVLTSYWTNVLLPVITTVVDWIVANLVPILADIAVWFMTNIPTAIQAVSDFFTGTLLPAMTDIWEFVDTYILPIFQALADIFTGVLGIAIDTLALIWTGVLLPALTDVWNFITASLQPVLDSLGEFFADTIGPPITGFVTGALDGLITGLDTVKTALANVIAFLQTLADIVANFDIEALWALIGQSPAPLAVGLASISAELPGVIAGLQELQGAIIGGPIYGDFIGDLGDAIAKLGDLSLGKGIGSFGGAVAGRMGKEAQAMADSIESINEQMALLEQGGIDITEATEWLALEQQRNTTTAEYLEYQKEIAEFQKAQADLAFLQQQMDFLDFLKENGLEAADILGGVQLGLDADMPALLAAMTAAMQQLIGAAEGELEIGSPSAVFAGIAQNLMNTMGNTIGNLMDIPARAMRGAVDAIITPAKAAMPIIGGAVTKSMNVNMTNNFSQPGDYGQFESMLDRYFARAFA